MPRRRRRMPLRGYVGGRERNDQIELQGEFEREKMEMQSDL